MSQTLITSHFVQATGASVGGSAARNEAAAVDGSLGEVATVPGPLPAPTPADSSDDVPATDGSGSSDDELAHQQPLRPLRGGGGAASVHRSHHTGHTHQSAAGAGVSRHRPGRAASGQPRHPHAKFRNLMFYTNRLPLGHRGPSIDEIHVRWAGSHNYGLLERKHDFIQWLFPTYTRSAFNPGAFSLEREEAALMRRDPDVGRRLVESYKLMLAFYGLKLVNARTGEVKRSDEWAYRSQTAIVRSSHNHLRIARILACCNILGFRTYALRLLERLTFEVERGGLKQLRYRRALGMWQTYDDPTTHDFAQYCMATEADLSETSAFLQLLEAERRRGPRAAVAATPPESGACPTAPAVTHDERGHDDERKANGAGGGRVSSGASGRGAAVGAARATADEGVDSGDGGGTDVVMAPAHSNVRGNGGGGNHGDGAAPVASAGPSRSGNQAASGTASNVEALSSRSAVEH